MKTSPADAQEVRMLILQVFSLQLVRNKRGHSMKTRREEDAARVFWRRESFGRLPRGK